MTSVFVTGGDGFVGRNLVELLLRRGYEVTSADIKHITPVIDGTRGPDLANEDVAMRMLTNRKYDVVVHLASSLSTPASLDRPVETFRNTVRTAVYVLEGCRQSMTPCILTSSVKARDGLTPYGTSKRMAEMWALEYRRAYGLPIIINRPGTIYGPGQEGSSESGWVAWFLKAKKESLKVTINGDGQQVRDLLHVNDYCMLILRQLEDFSKYASPGRIWDVGGGEENTVSVLQMADYLGLDYEFGPPRSGDASRYVGKNDAPGWAPTIYWKDTVQFR